MFAYSASFLEPQSAAAVAVTAVVRGRGRFSVVDGPVFGRGGTSSRRLLCWRRLFAAGVSPRGRGSSREKRATAEELGALRGNFAACRFGRPVAVARLRGSGVSLVLLGGFAYSLRASEREVVRAGDEGLMRCSIGCWATVWRDAPSDRLGEDVGRDLPTLPDHESLSLPRQVFPHGPQYGLPSVRASRCHCVYLPSTPVGMRSNPSIGWPLAVVVRAQGR